MRQAENKVIIEGILSEIDLKYGSFNKNGTQMKSIGGNIKIRVTQEINKEEKQLEIPIQMFASELTNKGTKNPAYESIEKVMNEFVSIAAAGEENADRVRINSGQIRMNEYWSASEQLISYPRVNASFVTRIKKDEMKSKATFAVEFVVANKIAEVDKDGVETGRIKVQGVLPQWGDKVDIIPFYAASAGVIDAVSNYWNDGDTVKASGKLDFSSQTETVYEEVDFGEPIEKSRTINVSDLIITGGSQTPLEEDFAFSTDEIKNALAARKADLEARKAKDMSRSKSRTAPAQSGLGSDLGF